MAQYTDWRVFARELHKRAAEVAPAMREATQEATDILHAESKERMKTGIYDIPEDRADYSFRKGKDGKRGKRYSTVTNAGGETGKQTSRNVLFIGGKAHIEVKHDAEQVVGGKKRWTRTGNLRRSETAKLLSPFQGAVDNAAEYALARHNLGLGPGDPMVVPPPPSKPRNTSRRAPWRRLAIQATVNQRFAVYRQRLWNVYRK